MLWTPQSLGSANPTRWEETGCYLLRHQSKNLNNASAKTDQILIDDRQQQLLFPSQPRLEVFETLWHKQSVISQIEELFGAFSE